MTSNRLDYDSFMKRTKELTVKSEITSIDVLEFKRETGYIFTRNTQYVTEEEYYKYYPKK